MHLKMINDNADILSRLISFLQENDPKFKDFELVSHVSLYTNLNNNEVDLFYTTLKECNKFSIADIPNLEQFQEMLIEKGIDENKITLDIVNQLLKAVIFENKLTSPLGLIAFKVYQPINVMLDKSILQLQDIFTNDFYNQSLSMEIYNTGEVLSTLISFLQENDPKFKDFELVSYVTYYVSTIEEKKIFFQVLNECVNLAIDRIPNLEQFQKMLIEKGIKENKFSNYFISKLLKAVIFENKLTSPLGLIADKIYQTYQMEV